MKLSKRKTASRLLGVLLCLMMVMGLLPTIALAADPIEGHALQGYDLEWAEGFEGADLPAGWTIEDRDGDGRKWEVFYDQNEAEKIHHGVGGIRSRSYENEVGELTPDNWLHLPQQILAAEREYILSFMMTAQDEEWPGDKVGVFISTDGGRSYSQLGEDYATTDEWQEINVDLSAYSGQTVNIAIVHHNSKDIFTVQLDCFHLWSKIAERISFSVKKEDDSGNPLKGAGFALTPREGTNSEGRFAYSDENGIATFDMDINPGTYTLSEASAPFGYVATSNKYTVIVFDTQDGDGNILSIKPIIQNSPVNLIPIPHRNGEIIATFANEPEEKDEISIPIEKTVVQGGNASPGAATFTFELLLDTGDEDNEGNHTYHLIDTAMITTNGVGSEDYTLTFDIPKSINSIDGFGQHYILLKETQDDTGGWECSPNQYHVTYMIEGEELKYQFSLLYHEDDGNHGEREPVDTATFTNTYTYNTNGGEGTFYGTTITVNKTDTQGKALAGASFVLADGWGREAYKATSNSSGIVRFTNVSNGTYTLLEKEAPNGYVISNETYELTVRGFHVTVNGENYSPVTFVNRKAAELNRIDHFAFLVGYTDSTFRPERNMTRAEVTTMFARLLTEQIEEHKTYPNTFTDVPNGYWAANYIGYMQQFGIITGYADGSFRPDAPVTRAEFAAIASRFEKLTEGSKNFTDVPNNYWASRYINFAATRGWVTGYADGTFKPENSITRAEVTAVTCRLLERSADQSYIRSHLSELLTFSDMTESHWAYWYAMEAANGHDYAKSGSSENWSRTYR